MAKTKCAECGTTVSMSGRFRFRASSGDWVCVGGCQPAEKKRDGSHSNWPIVTSHLGSPSDAPVTINSLRHLRQVERERGVVADAYSNDQSNW
jgi:hypothetical protein